MRFWSAMNSLIAMRILKRDADLGTQCGLGMRCGFWNATRVLERDAARHVATNALPPAESREHTPWGQSLARGIRQSFVRHWMEWVQSWERGLWGIALAMSVWFWLVITVD